MIDIVTDPFADEQTMRALWRSAWGNEGPQNFTPILKRSLVHVGAFNGAVMVGFVNVAWDGGQHGFVLDTCTHSHYLRQGIATRMVKRAVQEARRRGATWLHVDFEPHLEGFYRQCGFRQTAAGLMAL